MPARSAILLAARARRARQPPRPAAHAAWTRAAARSPAPARRSVHAAGNRHGSEALVWKVDSKRLVRLPAQTGLRGLDPRADPPARRHARPRRDDLEHAARS